MVFCKSLQTKYICICQKYQRDDKKVFLFGPKTALDQHCPGAAIAKALEPGVELLENVGEGGGGVPAALAPSHEGHAAVLVENVEDVGGGGAHTGGDGVTHGADDGDILG